MTSAQLATIAVAQSSLNEGLPVSDEHLGKSCADLRATGERQLVSASGTPFTVGGLKLRRAHMFAANRLNW
jgi:hypothetical protein